MSARSFGWSLLYVAGLIGVFIGERVIASGSGRWVATGIGVALVLLSLGARLLRLGKVTGDARRVETTIAALVGLGAVALGVYFLQSDLVMKPGDGGKAAVVLAALFPLLGAASVFPLLLVELAYASMAQAPVIEFGRVRAGLYAGLGLAGALVFVFAAVYVATERDEKVDLSYARTAKPGDSTRKIVERLDAPVQVSLFFPPANDVAEQVEEYFTDLAKGSPKLEIHRYDKDVDLAKARELNVSGNGAVVLSRGGKKEQLLTGTRIENARSQLRTLDQEVQKRLLTVSKPKRVIYFTVGHGERSDEGGTATDQRSGIDGLKEALRSQNDEVRNLGAGDGLASEVPADAAAVIVLGPEQTFLDPELDALSRYVSGGGRLLLAVDPESKSDFTALLNRMGMRLGKVALANEQAVQIRRQISDRLNLAATTYSSHPSVTTLSQLGSRAAVVFLGAGAVESVKEKPNDVALDVAVRASPTTWNDLNGDFEFSAPLESRRPWELVVAASFKGSKPPPPAGQVPAKDAGEARVLVVGDSDVFTDFVLRNPANQIFALEAVRWLLGDDAISGTINTEADAPILHTRKQDVAWFYSTVFLIPAAVLGIGFAVTRRRGAARKSAGPAKERA